MTKLKGGWLAPFWGKKGYSTGRDPLGMQVASIGTYAILLPGLTNLTRRIRYYSFYCWLVERYAIDESHTDSDVFRRFIRRGELQFAYGMALCFPESPAVVGSDWASRVLKGFGETPPDEINIAGGADQNGGATYWKYGLGAFGQYFLGSLLHLGLLREREGSTGVFLCTENGRKLATCFASGVDQKLADAFISAVGNGTVKVETLREIMPSICLEGISVNSDEWKFLVELLMGPDDGGGRGDSPTFFRKQTMGSYINFLSTAPEGGEVTFSQYNYKKVIESGIAKASEVQLGWFIYESNEIAHYSMGAVFWGLLEILRAKAHPIPYRDLENEITTGLLEELGNLSSGKLGKNSGTREAADFVSAWGSSEEQLESSIYDCLDRDKIYAAMAFGIFLALKLYLRLNLNRDALCNFALERGMAREGDFLDLISFLGDHQAKPLVETILTLVRRNIVNRHIEESVRKMGSGIRNTLKFRNEDGYLFHILTVSPQRTQPRLGSLTQFLTDLKMLDAEESVTPYGADLSRGMV